MDIPPMSEVVTCGRVLDRPSNMVWGVVEPATTLPNKPLDGLSVGRTLVNLRAKEVPIHLLNLTDQQKQIKQGTDVVIRNTAESVLVENPCSFGRHSCGEQTDLSDKRRDGASAGTVSSCAEQSIKGETAGVDLEKSKGATSMSVGCNGESVGAAGASMPIGGHEELACVACSQSPTCLVSFCRMLYSLSREKKKVAQVFIFLVKKKK